MRTLKASIYCGSALIPFALCFHLVKNVQTKISKEIEEIKQCFSFLCCTSYKVIAVELRSLHYSLAYCYNLIFSCATTPIAFLRDAIFMQFILKSTTATNQLAS